MMEVSRFIKKIDQLVKINKPIIAFGLARPDKQIIESLKKASKYARIILVGPRLIKKHSNFDVIADKDPEKKLALLLAQDKVDGIVRGTLDSFKVYENYTKITGEKYTIMPALIEDSLGRIFFLEPISNPEGWSKEERLKIAKELANLVKEFGISPRIAVFSGEREGSYNQKKDTKDGVIGILNKTYEDAEWISKKIKQYGYNIKNYTIELNLAIEDNYNILIPVNGMVGNQLARIILSCGGRVMMIPRLGLSRCYEECSRTEKDFKNHVKWLVALINKKRKIRIK